MTHALPSSPNWYCSKVLDVINDEIVVFGAKYDLNILQVKLPKTSSSESDGVDTFQIQASSFGQLTQSSLNSNSQISNGLDIPDVRLQDANNSLSTLGPVTVSGGKEGIVPQIQGPGLVPVVLGPVVKNKNDCGSTADQPTNCHSDCILICTLTRAHKERITAARWSRSSSSCYSKTEASYSIFSGADDGKIKLHSLSWTRSTCGEIRSVKSKLLSEYQLPKNCKVTCIEVCDEQLLIGDDKGNITGWKWMSGLTNISKPSNTAVFSLEFEASKNLLAAGTRGGGIFLYDVSSFQIVSKLRGHDDEVQCLQWRPTALADGSGISGQLISGGKDRTMKLWDINSRRCVTTAKFPNSYTGGAGNRARQFWLSFAWLPTGQVISASATGELLVWTLAWNKVKYTSLVNDGPKGHNRLVFTLTLFGGGRRMISTSMDRSMIVWDICAKPLDNAERVPVAAPSELSEIEAEQHTVDDDEGLWRRSEQPADKNPQPKSTCTGRVLMNISTFGGFVYCIRTSPVDPGRLAIGVGDNVIRIWNVNEGAGSYNLTNLWQGLKSKITSVSWHPYIEGQLAYGTEDGRIGVFPNLSKKPFIFSSYHQRMVYVVSWGPPPLTDAPVTSQSMTVYSVGDGTVLIHNLGKAASEPARDLNELLAAVNGPTLPTRIRSEIAWSPDYSQLYLGSEDGSVLVFRRSDLKCVCTIKVASKLVNAIRVQPMSHMTSTRLLAIGSNEHQVKIVDLSSISAVASGDGESIPIISDAVVVLKGHKGRVTDVCWSWFECNKLVSVSYDGKALVWDTTTGTILSEYQHHGHLLTCQWSLLNADLIYTGSSDFSLHSWRPSCHLKMSPSSAAQPSADSTEENSVSAEAATGGEGLTDVDDISKLIEQKKQELLTAKAGFGLVNGDTRLTAKSFSREAQSAETTESANDIAVVQSKKQHASKKKKTMKTLFPNLSSANKRGKESDIDDLLYMQQQINNSSPLTMTDGKEHLGIFSSNADDFNKFLDKEKDTIFADDNYEYAGYMCLWQGEVEEVLLKAAAAGSLTDCLVNSASMLGYKEWLKYCALYAQQLRHEGFTHKAVNYLLCTHDVETAIRWLSEDNLYREAICIARSRYPPDSEKIQQLYQGWSRQMRRDANYETAAKCFVGLKDSQSALDVLCKRTDLESSLKAIRFAMVSPDCAEELMVLCDKLTRQCMLSGDHKVVETLCTPNPTLHAFLAWSLVTQSLSPVLDTGCSPTISDLGLVGYIRSILSAHSIELQHCRKRCSLSQHHISPLQAKVAICERLLNLAVDADAKVPAGKDAVSVFTMIMTLQPDCLGQSSAVLSARLIHLLTLPGCDVISRLRDCSFEPSHSLSDYALYICYLWSAITINTYSGSSEGGSGATPTRSRPSVNDVTAGLSERLGNSVTPEVVDEVTELSADCIMESLTHNVTEQRATESATDSVTETPAVNVTELTDGGVTESSTPSVMNSHSVPESHIVSVAELPTASVMESLTHGSTERDIKHTAESAGVENGQSPAADSPDCNGKPAHETKECHDRAADRVAAADLTSLTAVLSTHMYQLAFSLCNGIFLPWVDPPSIRRFNDHLHCIEKTTASGKTTLPSFDVMSLMSFVDKENPEPNMDTKVLKCVLAMLLDTLRQLFYHMCCHDDSGHLPNLPPGRQLIKEWVTLHATCHEVGISHTTPQREAGDSAQSTLVDAQFASANGSATAAVTKNGDAVTESGDNGNVKQCKENLI